LGGYIVFEGAPFYHVLEDEDETACGVLVAPVSTLSGRPAVTHSEPRRVLPCKHCLKALGRSPAEAAPPRQTDRIEVGDRVQVAAGPQAGKVGQVTGVIRARGAVDSSAVFKVKFPDGGEAGHVGANLKKVSP
jgi:hypothetical protein